MLCDNFTCLHTRQDQNELHLKRRFFLPKSACSVNRSHAHLAKRSSAKFTTIFVRRKDKTNYLSNQTFTKKALVAEKNVRWRTLKLKLNYNNNKEQHLKANGIKSLLLVYSVGHLDIQTSIHRKLCNMTRTQLNFFFHVFLFINVNRK